MTIGNRASRAARGTAAIAAAMLAGAPAAAQSGGRYEYAVKYVCGANFRPILSSAAAPGAYYTAINVHNPSAEAVPFVYKVALAPLNAPGGHTPLVSPYRLGEDGATDVDCLLITRALDAASIPHGPFWTGFFVIQSPVELDVVAVYTSAATRTGPVNSIQTERVPVRRRGG
jgi:hypothetical protein